MARDGREGREEKTVRKEGGKEVARDGREGREERTVRKEGGKGRDGEKGGREGKRGR